MRHAVLLCLTIALALFFELSTTQAQPDYAPAHWDPPACAKYYNSGNGRHFLVIHDMEGYYLTSISYLNRCDTDTNGNYNVSASIHYSVNGIKNGFDEDGHTEGDTGDAPAGDITQSVRESKYAWHARCLNTWSFGTEHEGFVSSPAWYTETMYVASAALQRHLADVYGVPKDRNHIIGHDEWQNAMWVAWMSTNYPSIDPSCNTHTDPGIYWDWNHFMALVNGLPGINRQPWSRAVDRGSNASFIVSALGSAPLSYQWRKNGTNLAGATTSSLTISNVQTTNAAGYSCIIANSQGSITSRVAALTVNPVWVPAFADNLDANTAANWNLFWGAGNSVSDFTTNWAFNFSNVTYVANGVTNPIPAAPNSAGSKLALKITVNKNDATPATAGVSLYPKNVSFSNSYSLRFDAWINYNGSAGGGSGSTEYVSCGLNHTGTRVNWTTSATTSDGLWFAVDGEGGSGGSDYRAYLATGGAPTAMTFANGGLAASGATSDNARDDFYCGLFPPASWESSGTPGKGWAQIELSQIGNLITWQINGVVLAQRTNTSAYTNGNVMIGYFDPFTSIANPAVDNFVLLDNVRVLIAAVAPTISVQPLSQTNRVGSNVTFFVTATGLPSPGYQWRFNGANIATATASSFTRSNLTTNDAGDYSVLVTNIGGSVTSAVAQLTVLVPVPPVFSNVAVSANQFQFTLSGTPGISITVFRSDDLTNWVMITNLPNPSGSVQFFEPVSPSTPQRFYRAQSP